MNTKKIVPLEQINERLKAVRKAFKLSQKAFCETIGFNQSYYSAVENGKKAVTSNIIAAIKENFSISSDWLYSGSGEMFLTNGTEELTHKNLPRLPKLEKGKISEVEKSINKKDDTAYSDDDLLRDWLEGSTPKYWNSIPHSKHDEIRQTIEKQALITRKVYEHIETDHPEITRCRRSLDILRSYEDVGYEVFNNGLLNDITTNGINSVRYYQNKDYDSFKTALIADLQRFKPFIDAVCTIADAVDQFVKEIAAMGEENTEIVEGTFNEYLKLNG